MKINEAEQLLGITKANIRFYEKEGLICPTRNESGYRDYTDAHIAQLKQIVILRKLGIPVQQIGDILDGVLPLQEAINSNIASLQAQIEELNGALALSRQLRSENADTLDAERYWNLIRSQENQGFRFHALVDDYLKFTEINYAWLLWPLPGDALRSPWEVVKFIIIIDIATALIRLPLGEPFIPTFLRKFVGSIGAIALWTAIFIPVYLLRRKKPKLAKGIMNFLLVAAVSAVFIIPIVVFIYIIATP